QTKIINGIDVDPAVSPQMVEVLLTFPDGEGGLCSGVIIGREKVLTAAHCFLHDGAMPVGVRAGGVIYPVSEVAAAPGYREDSENVAICSDVAVVTADGLSLPALPILLSAPLTEGSSVNVYGFGLDENGEFGTLKS